MSKIHIHTTDKEVVISLTGDLGTWHVCKLLKSECGFKSEVFSVY